MPVWCTRIAGLASEDISRIQRLNSRDNEPQTHHSDAGPHSGEKCPLVAENLGFDFVRIEPPLFVLNIHHLLGVVVPHQFVLLFAHGLARGAAESVNCPT
jgi:hypothetical protein